MRLSADMEAVNNVALARRMYNLGMMPKLINDFIPGTKKLVRSFDNLNPKLYFSRGYSKTWAKSNDGFKMSNILLKIYGIVSGDPSLRKGVDIVYTATAWEVATIQYPELINKKICDISRFTYLLKKVVSNEFLVSVCKTPDCCNKFIVHEDNDRYFCWACAENYSTYSLNKKGDALHSKYSLPQQTLYAPRSTIVKECFDSSVYLSASRHMFLSSKAKA
jgi:hypothetical protein